MTEPTELSGEILRQWLIQPWTLAIADTQLLVNDLLAAREKLAQAEARFAAGDEHFPWSATEFGTLCCCGEEMDAQERCLSNKGLQQRAEAAEADCAALREHYDDNWIDFDLGTVRACCRTLDKHKRGCILASPNPGAGLLAELEQARTQAASFSRIADDEHRWAQEFMRQRDYAEELLTDEQREGLLGPSIPDIGGEGETDESDLGNHRRGRHAQEGDSEARGTIWVSDPEGRSGVLSSRDGGLTRHDPAGLEAKREQARKRIAELEAELDARLAIRAEYHSHQPRRDREASS